MSFFISYLFGVANEKTIEFAEVLTEDGKARFDGEYDAVELSRIQKEIKDLIKKAEQIKIYIDLKKGEK